MKSDEKATGLRKELKEKTTRGRKKAEEEMMSDAEIKVMENKQEKALDSKKDPKKKKSLLTKKLFFQSILILLGIAIGMAVYHQFFANRLENQQKKIISSLSEIMILPQEEATIFDVNDPELLTKDQDFFVGSIKGDKLIVYPIAGKAIIYRPDKHLIVNVGPVMFDEQNNAN